VYRIDRCEACCLSSTTTRHPSPVQVQTPTQQECHGRVACPLRHHGALLVHLLVLFPDARASEQLVAVLLELVEKYKECLATRRALRETALKRAEAAARPVAPQRARVVAPEFPYSGQYLHMDKFPSREELFYKPDDLNSNLVSRPYPSVELYLETMYRLLREETFGPLRGVWVAFHGYVCCLRLPAVACDNKTQYLSSCASPEGIQGLQHGAGHSSVKLRVFHNVTVQSVIPSNRGLVHVLGLDMNDKRVARINWKQTRLLMKGSLLALVSEADGFREQQVLFADCCEVTDELPAF
jgi:hypothetical protein